MIRRLFTVASHKLKRIEDAVKEKEKSEQKFEINLGELEQLIGIMSKCVKSNLDIIKIVDHDKRLEDIEAIIKNIPPEIIQQVKAKLKI